MLITVKNLAQLYQSQEKYDEAKAMNERALKGNRKTLGPDHLFMLNSRHSLAYVLYKQKDYPAASTLYEQAWVGYRMLLGRDILPQRPVQSVMRL
jgi:tetratricopeptide (TPR) repeat protein